MRNALSEEATELSAERGRSKAGTNTAASTRLLCARLAAQPNPSVILCWRAIVFSIGMRYHTPAPAQHAAVADRFAREILAILAGSAKRSRRLSGNPFGADAFSHLSMHVSARASV